MRQITKHAFCIVAAMFMFVASTMAQTTMKHIVDRGETLETIAERYGITKETIVQNNPQAAQFIYAGMELTIPTKVATSNDSQSINRTQSQTERTTSSPKVESSTDYSIENIENCSESNYKNWEFTYNIGYGFLKKAKGVKGSNWAYTAAFGGSSFVAKNFFLGAMIGYNSSSHHMYHNGTTAESDSYFITLPLKMGYNIEIVPPTFSIVPYVGLDINYCVKSKLNYKIGKESFSGDTGLDGKFAAGFRLGLKLNFGGLGLGGAFVLPLNDYQKSAFGEDAYPEISLGSAF